MPTTERPAFEDELDADLNQVVEYIALSFLAEEVSFIAAPLRRIMVAFLGALPDGALSPYRRHLRDILTTRDLRGGSTDKG